MRGPRALALAAICLTAVLLPIVHAASPRTIEVTLTDQGCPDGDDRFCVQPATIAIADGDTVTLSIENEGQVQHNLSFEPGTPEVLAKHATGQAIPPNGTLEIEIPWADIETAIDEADTRTFLLRCGFEGHAALGETATFTVEGGESQNPQPLGWPLAVAGLIGAALLVGRLRR